VPASRVNRVWNKLKKTWELQIEGNVPLDNPTFQEVSKMADKVTLDREALIMALRQLEIIVPSLARMGSLGTEVTRDEHARILSAFFDDWDVGPRLAKVRRILSEAFEYGEYENLFEDVPVWRDAQRKPPPDWRFIDPSGEESE
jgi:hypothetical protein